MRKRESSIIIVSISILLLSLFFTFEGDKKIILSNKDKGLVEKCRDVSDKYNCMRDSIDKYRVGRSSLESINYLNQILKEGSLATYCHTLAHYLGKIEYRDSKSIESTLTEGGKSCSDGFYHGAIEEFALDVSIEEFKREIDNYCSLIKDKYLNMDCVHGLGHGAYVLGRGDIDKSTSICEGVEIRFNRMMCVSGVFMQSSLDRRIEYKKEDLPSITNICDIEKFDGFKEGCLNNIFLKISINEFSNSDFITMREICNKYAEKDKIDCYYGIGYASPGLVNFNPEFIAEFTCGNEISRATERCIHRSSQAYGAVFGMEAMRRELCGRFNRELRRYCLSVKEIELR